MLIINQIIKTKNFFASKAIIKKVKRQQKMGENICK